MWRIICFAIIACHLGATIVSAQNAPMATSPSGTQREALPSVVHFERGSFPGRILPAREADRLRSAGALSGDAYLSRRLAALESPPALPGGWRGGVVIHETAGDVEAWDCTAPAPGNAIRLSVGRSVFDLLRPSNGVLVQFDSDPPGASIYLRGIDSGYRTETEGFVSMELLASARFQMAGFKPVQITPESLGLHAVSKGGSLALLLKCRLQPLGK